jgi:hypothetical protein
MIKFIAQMKNPRRGHDAQGKLKKIHLDPSPEGYSNFMAPGRVRWIKEQVERLPADDPDRDIFTEDILKPEADTYLTPTWDEMVPFPMTWKIRFDGFGQSDYRTASHPYGRIAATRLPDDTPPFYQPQGASHIGGTFAAVVCVCAAAKAKARADEKAGTEIAGEEEEKHELHCPCLGEADANKKKMGQTSQLSTGCGLGGSVVHY